MTFHSLLPARAARLLPILFFSFVSALRAQTPLPAGEPLVSGGGLPAFELQLAPHAKEAGRLEACDANGPGFREAWRVSTLRDIGPEFAIELRGSNACAVSLGDVSMLRFFVRAADISDETGTAHIGVGVRGGRFAVTYEGDFPVTREWQEILVPFEWKQSYEKGQASILFQFGYKRQIVEIGGFEALYYGHSLELKALPRTRFTYAGREAGAPWRKAALERIERIRKGPLVVEVEDAAGRPVSEAKIVVRQLRSSFQWGTALQMRRLVADGADNLRYRQVVQEFFNAATAENDLKWPAWSGEWPGPLYSKEQTLAALRWLRERDFHVRGHVFVWPGQHNLPKAIVAMLDTPAEKEIPRLVNEHIRDEARATRGLIDEWDVLNEPFTNHTLMDRFGDEIMPTWFETAREELPGAPLYLNDFSNHDRTTDAEHVAHFEKTARYLLERGAPLGGLGVQAHFNSRPNAPENILAVFDSYSETFHLPIRVTEFDVWTYDEELQSDFTRDFLILAFSHPAVVGVQYWGFWETAHWRPSAAMFRADWSEKPNAKVYRDLVLDAWRTNLDGATDSTGRFLARGFHGDYEVTASFGGKRAEGRLSIAAGSENPVLRLRLP